MNRDETAVIECPYCGESVEIVFEADLEGEMVWDCEICCRPWRLWIKRLAGGSEVHVQAEDE